MAVEENLLEKVRSGDSEAVERVWNEYKMLLWNLCRRYTNTQDELDEIAQEATLRFIKNMRYWNKLHKGYIWKCLESTCKGAFKEFVKDANARRKNEVSVDELTDESARDVPDDSGVPFEETIADRDERSSLSSKIQAALPSLSSKELLILGLRQRGCSNKKIAEKLELNEKDASQIWIRLCKKLREAIS